MSIFTGLVAQWILRRVMELGGLLGSVLVAWNNLPPEMQGAVLALLSRNWETITLGTLIPIAIAVWGYLWSFISTIKPQVVTTDGKQIAMPPDSAGQAKVEAIAKTTPRPKTLFERLFGKK